MTNKKFQDGVHEWLEACFQPEVRADRLERTYRFLEEALELAQASGCSEHDAIELVRYVFARPSGQLDQEVGGALVTLAGLCSACGIDMEAAGQHELARNWSRIDAIREKSARKPRGTPLPQ